MIIGICGANRAGKNTVGHILSRELHKRGLTNEQFAFADALYDMCNYIFNTPPKADCEKYGILKEMKSSTWGNKTVRDVLIATGAFCRSIHPDY